MLQSVIIYFKRVKGRGVSLFLLGNEMQLKVEVCVNTERIFFLAKNSLLYFILSLRCLKITEKVSFNIWSEASYIYILGRQKLIKNVKNGPFWRVFENLKLTVIQCYQTG